MRKISAKVKPKLNEEFVATLKIPQVKSVADLRAYLKRVAQEQAVQDARSNFQRMAFAKIRQTSKIPITPLLIDREAHRQEQQFENEIKRQGMEAKDYEQMTGQTHDQMHAQFRAVAEQRLKEALIFAEISKREKIEVTDADYEAMWKRYAEAQNQTMDAVKQLITKEQLQIPLTNDKVIDFLISRRLIKKVEEAAPKSEVKKEATKQVRSATKAMSTKAVEPKTESSKEATKGVKSATVAMPSGNKSNTKSVKQENTKVLSDKTKTMKVMAPQNEKDGGVTKKIDGTKALKAVGTKAIGKTQESSTRGLKSKPSTE